MADSNNRYSAIMLEIFTPIISGALTIDQISGAVGFEFPRSAIIAAANKLKLTLPKNAGDVVYAFRYREELPDAILYLAPAGEMWILMGAGRSKYRARLIDYICITPSKTLTPIKIPDATPPNIRAHAGSDEQQLLSRVRDNQLVGLFVGIKLWSHQNHLRTTVKSMGQIEIDEIYLGIDKYGVEYVVPVQAKRNKDKHGIVQTLQDIAYCKEKFPNHVCIPVSVHFIEEGGIIAMFKLAEDVEKMSIKLIEELHYTLNSTWE
ncbi:endonuclease [Pseudomonas serbica]|uniref:endonuclease n=1 Tax=Pseudomonas serbica TaxID=2965074 RepID=UPI00237BDFDC|nr:endonuclease [Pseudomonas serbica]